MKRITKAEALDLIKNADLKELGRMATKRKKELHPEGITTFVVDRNINYTNICWVDCKFCAFYRHEKDADAYVLTFEVIFSDIASRIPQSHTLSAYSYLLLYRLRAGLCNKKARFQSSRFLEY